MDITFIGPEKDKLVVIYLDDITVFSISDVEHCEHLKRVFLKCRKFGLSLNPEKSLFPMKEGKLLGHIVSAEGVRIDPRRKFISYVPPYSVKDILIQPDIDGRRSKWISQLLEFDLEIKPTKLVKGRGLAKILVELIANLWGSSSSSPTQKINRLSCLIQAHRASLHWQSAPSTKTL
jgi:hypothetical protein